jgi:hypothetical protein
MSQQRNGPIVARVILILVLIIFYSSCHYDNLSPITPKAPKVYWALDSSLRGENKFLTNSITISNSLLLAANSFSLWNVVPSQINQTIYGNYIDLLQAESDLYPPSLSKDIGVSLINKNKLVIFPTICSSCLANQIIFIPPYSSSATSVKGMSGQGFFYSGGNKGGYPAIESKYLLVPFECDFNSKSASIALIKIDTAINPLGSKTYGPKMSLNSYKIINIEGVPVDGLFCAAYFDKFFLFDYGNSWRIDTLGNAKKLPLYLQQMFTINDLHFALSINSQLFVSSDQGENWSLFATLGPGFASLQYYNVGKELYAGFESQIWKATMTGNQISFVELDNHGLETNLITSINKCGKYAFVTTTAGLFYKDTVALNTPKGK